MIEWSDYQLDTPCRDTPSFTTFHPTGVCVQGGREDTAHRLECETHSHALTGTLALEPNEDFSWIRHSLVGTNREVWEVVAMSG